MIRGLDQEQFVAILKKHLSPATPIQSQENLRGRDAQLRTIEQALCAAGRTIFIYGDRGVGKTSLAHTAAFAHQSSNRDPILLGCRPQTTFSQIMSQAINGLQRKRSASSATHKVKVDYMAASASYETGRITAGDDPLPNTLDLNDAIALLLKTTRERKDEQTVVVIDEFDRIKSNVERTHFADFIKQVGDQNVGVRFIFCGVAESLDKLLGAHESCYRYIESIEVQRLSWEARWEIVDSAANALNVAVEEHPRYRIAAVSDGFPHYVHLVCEKLFWKLFDDPVERVSPTPDHYGDAITGAVLSIEQHLKKVYDHAVMKDSDGYEEVLWAIADHPDLTRNIDSIFDSYRSLMGTDEQQLDRTTFSARLQSLKGKGCKHILVSPRVRWYRFRESIMRGYVRLRAEEKGFELAYDYGAASTSDRSVQLRGARSSRRGWSRRDWDRLKNPPK